MDAPTEYAAWSRGQRILFRFAFVYLVLYNLPFPLSLAGQIPGFDVLLETLGGPWSNFVIWTGKHVFHVTATVHPTGSGDTMLAWVEVFCILSLSVLATILWTLLDRRRTEYTRLHDALRTYVRFSLATAMFLYGASKVIQSQFGLPGPDRLTETYGESSPMGLLWTFMGASTAYSAFAGASEMLGGLLLVARRTALLGALVCIGVMGNVLMLNLSYDVPVKLYSAHLLAMAVFLTLPDLRRLFDFFVRNRPVPAAEIRPLFTAPWSHRASLVLRALFFTGVAVFWLYESYSNSKEYGNLSKRPPFHGAWNVEEMEVAGKVLPPLLTDPVRWRQVNIAYPGFLSIRPMPDGGEKTYYRYTISKERKRWVLTKGTEPKAQLSYEEPSPGVLLMTGTLDGQPVRLKLSKIPESKFLLLSRGFHWVSEYPFNR